MSELPPSFTRIEYIAPGDLVRYEGNARKHPKKQIQRLADSIRAFGFNAPVLINANNVLLAGHGRVEAAKLLGLATIPCLRLEHMSEEEQRGYILADNRIAEVVGKAGAEPLYPSNPFASANRRMTIVLLREAPPLPAGTQP